MDDPLPGGRRELVVEQGDILIRHYSKTDFVGTEQKLKQNFNQKIEITKL